jgi:UDP-3-O-[3-hydroxymyristoyl] glucosamine N-acyltransferase
MIEVGKHTKFGPGACAHRSAQIGMDTQVGPHVWIGQNVVIGNDCRIQAGTIIGEEGFGYVRDASGRWVPKDHDFTVRIDDDVHIGANTCIDRGSWRDTHIMQGARIDNLVHIAHNVIVGANAVIVAGAEVSGSVWVGEGAWIGPHACIKERVEIGKGALIGMGAVVLKDVPPNTTWAGNPARCINENVGVREAM